MDDVRKLKQTKKTTKKQNKTGAILKNKREHMLCLALLETVRKLDLYTGKSLPPFRSFKNASETVLVFNS